MTSQDTGLGLHAVHAYFQGERRELLTMFLGSLALVAASLVLAFMVRDGFTRGLVGVVLVFGLIFGGGAVSLLVRDFDLKADIKSAIDTTSTAPAASAALEGEKVRVAIVLSKFTIYRIIALVLATIALGCMILLPGGWVHAPRRDYCWWRRRKPSSTTTRKAGPVCTSSGLSPYRPPEYLGDAVGPPRSRFRVHSVR